MSCLLTLRVWQQIHASRNFPGGMNPLTDESLTVESQGLVLGIWSA